MKTIETIVERLRTKYGDNGRYYVFGEWLKDFKVAIERDDNAHGTGTWLRLDERAGALHDKLDGFLWGLNAARVITDRERSQASEELTALRWPKKEETAAAPAAERAE
jgi:hypothetical protein